METHFRGKADRYGAHVDTDVMISARYLVSSNPEFLASHCMEAINPDFVKRVRPGDIIVAETNFGCGSSREHVPIAVKGAGVSCVIAKSFARIFFRNSINLGLPVVESDDAVDGIEMGDEVDVDLTSGIVTNITKPTTFQAKPFEPFVLEILEAGGLLGYTRQKILQTQSGNG